MRQTRELVARDQTAASHQLAAARHDHVERAVVDQVVEQQQACGQRALERPRADGLWRQGVKGTAQGPTRRNPPAAMRRGARARAQHAPAFTREPRRRPGAHPVRQSRPADRPAACMGGRADERPPAPAFQRLERRRDAALRQLQCRELAVRPAPLAPEGRAPVFVQDARGEPLGLAGGAAQAATSDLQIATRARHRGLCCERQMPQPRRGSPRSGGTRLQPREPLQILARSAQVAALEPRTRAQRQHAALALAVAGQLEALARRGQHRRGRARVAIAPPHGGEAHQRLAGPHRVALGVERRQRALEPGARGGGLSEPELCQGREGLGLGALVAQLHRAAVGDRALRFVERFVVGAQTQEDLGAVERRQRPDRGEAARARLVAHPGQPREGRFVAVLEKVEGGQVVVGDQRVELVAGRVVDAAGVAVELARLIEPPEQRQAVGDVAVYHRGTARVPGPRQGAPRLAIAQQRPVGQVEPVEQVALVVEQARERHPVAGALEQAAPGRRRALRLAVTPQVHERIGEADGTAALLAGIAGTAVPGGGAAVGERRRARALQPAQHVAAQPPQLAATGVVAGARAGSEPALEQLPGLLRVSLAQRLDALDQGAQGPVGVVRRHRGLHGSGPRARSGGGGSACPGHQ